MKQKTFIERLKSFIAQQILSDPLGRGYEVWLKLDEQLPQAVGAKVNDEPRVKQFEQMIKKLSFLDYYALKSWMTYRYDTLKYDWDNAEHFTGSVEQYYTKQIQICKEHLEVMA